MKKQKGYELRDICGEKVIIATGVESIDVNKMLVLNETAAFMWEAMGDADFEALEIAKKTCEVYNITEERALQSVNRLLDDMKRCGVVK